MKKLQKLSIILMILLLMVSCMNGPGKQDKGDAGIEFMETTVEFGSLEFSAPAKGEFVFTNTGDAPLLVSHVKSTCGCTVPDWSNEPVKPGDAGRIQVSYDTHRVGRFIKSIYVYSNAAEGTQRLYISGEVLPPEESVP